MWGPIPMTGMQIISDGRLRPFICSKPRLEKRGNIVQVEAETVFALQICRSETDGTIEGLLPYRLRKNRVSSGHGP